MIKIERVYDTVGGEDGSGVFVDELTSCWQ